MSFVRRMMRWLRSAEAEVECPICGRQLVVAGNIAQGPGVFPTAIPRPVEEIVAACREQHGTNHTAGEVATAKEDQRRAAGS